jgi:hypothetical protein
MIRLCGCHGEGKLKHMRFSGEKLWKVAKRNCENMKHAFEHEKVNKLNIINGP